MANNLKSKTDGTIEAFDKVFSNYMMRAQVQEWQKKLDEMESRRGIEIVREQVEEIKEDTTSSEGTNKEEAETETKSDDDTKEKKPE